MGDRGLQSRTKPASPSASYLELGFRASLRRTETRRLKSGKVTQLLRRPGRPSETSPCLYRDLPPASCQSFPGVLGSRWGWGDSAEPCGKVSGGSGGLKCRWEFTPPRTVSSEGEGSATPPWGLSLQLTALSALTRYRTTAGRKSHLHPGLANSGLHPSRSSATRAPADGECRVPALRSAGFKTDLIPQPAWVPPPNR